MPLTELTQIAVYLAMIIASVYLLIFIFHWDSYGSKKRVNALAALVYTVGAIVLIGIMYVSQLYF